MYTPGGVHGEHRCRGGRVVLPKGIEPLSQPPEGRALSFKLREQIF